MPRPLTVLAVGGLAISAICLSLARSLAADDLPALDLPFGNQFGWRAIFSESCTATRKGDATAISREFAWDGDDAVAIDIPADVHYRPGPGKNVVVRGTPETLRHVRVDDGTIDFDCDWNGGRPDTLDVTLPGGVFRSFSLNGSGHLFLDDINQDALKIGIRGSGGVRGNGTADRLDIVIAGSGDADLGRLSVKRLRMVIAGSGSADASPQDEADVVIAGSGNVHLHSQPKHLSQKVAGSGRVVVDASI